MNKRSTISIRYEVYSMLRDIGKFGESFSDVLERLLTQYKTKQVDNIN